MKSISFWLLFLLLTFTVNLPVSWWGLAKADFFYPVLHDSIGIDQHIKKYAPRNLKNKKGFEKTTKAQRVELFHGIVKAIHNQGDGLETLSYTDKQQVIMLLTEAEVIHLTDVAKLLEKLKPAMFVVFIIWLVLLSVLFIRRIKLPSVKQFLLTALFLIFVSVLILSFGPEKSFNQLHIWIFPENHQWFFYYEDSLMSTMMKAPDIFAYISVFWFLLSSFITVVVLKIVYLMSASNLRLLA